MFLSAYSDIVHIPRHSKHMWITYAKEDSGICCTEMQ